MFIDETGGFGSELDRPDPAAEPSADRRAFCPRRTTKSRYENKRAEMYFDVVQWIKGGGALPDDRRAYSPD